MRNKILITGETGFLGRILTKTLAIKNEIVLFKTNKHEKVDISKPFDLNHELEIEIIIHAAGKAHSIPNSQTEESVFYDVNYQGTKNLCMAIEKLSAKPASFIFISTVSVYGTDKGSMVTEDYPLNGSTPYAKSKILAEAFLINWAKENNIVLSILRLPLIAGPNPPGNLGAMISGIKTGKYLSIGNADAMKSMVWAEDICDIIPTLKVKGGIYNLTDGQNPSFRELENSISGSLNEVSVKRISLFLAKAIAMIGNLLGPKSPINTNKLTKITSTLTFDDTKARRELKWNPNKVLDKISEIV